MVKVEYKSYITRCAQFGKYIIEIKTSFENINYDELWICNKEYGIKEMLIGVTNMDQHELDQIILDNIDKWIDKYKEKFED